jgi:hypothetical protein
MSPLRQVWKDISRRTNPASTKFAGIDLEWSDFRSFEVWAEVNGWQKGLLVARIDKTGSYSAENCCIRTRAEENGLRPNVKRLPDGRRIRDVLKIAGVPNDKKNHQRFFLRVFRSGWNEHFALTENVTPHSERRAMGEKMKIKSKERNQK